MKTTNEKWLFGYTLIFIYMVHLVIGYSVYSLAYYLVGLDSQSMIKAANQPMPSIGELWILFAMVLALFASILVSILSKRFVTKRNNLQWQSSIREFVLLNILPIAFVLIIIYLIFDPLISTAAYLAFFIFLIFFREY